jgi:hypothetical protein
MSSKEADIQLALFSIKHSQIQSNYRAAATYKVPETTLHHQRARISARRDYQPNSKKLTLCKEEVIISYILDLD